MFFLDSYLSIRNFKLEFCFLFDISAMFEKGYHICPLYPDLTSGSLSFMLREPEKTLAYLLKRNHPCRSRMLILQDHALSPASK